jgi:hypothetical protein
MPGIFRSFFQAGFECSCHLFPGGRRLDLLETTGHARHPEIDYRAAKDFGLHTGRDGLRWHLVEPRPGSFEWHSLLPQLKAAANQNMQVIWDLCHYGWPPHLDVWAPGFPDAFGRYASAAAAFIRDHCPVAPFYCPINEISYWSWGGGEMAHFGPSTLGRGAELKKQLVRATLTAMDCIRATDRRARFVLADPIIRVCPSREADRAAAAAHTQGQYEAWDMISGRSTPSLGGFPACADIIGVNFYPHNQWLLDGPPIAPGDKRYTPLRDMLKQVHERYGRPILIAETGSEGPGRADWLRYVCDEAAAVIAAGIPIEGVCLYPITDYPGWEDDRSCPTGLFGFPDEHGRRPVYRPLAMELAAQQLRFGDLLHGGSQTTAMAAPAPSAA